MPDYVCNKCKTDYPDCKLRPVCNKKPGCNNGAWVVMKVVAPTTTTVVQALLPPASYTHDTSVRNNFTGGHKPSGACYVHHGGKYAISPDGSTHSSGNACWKGFKLGSHGWYYLGSYDANLAKADRGGNSGGDSQLPL